MNKTNENTLAKILQGSEEWLNAIKSYNPAKGTEINLWGSYASNLSDQDYVHIYDQCKGGYGRVHFTATFVRNELLTLQEAWDLYGEHNGAESLEMLKRMVLHTLKGVDDSNIESHLLKCTILKNVSGHEKTPMFIYLEGKGQIRASGRFA